MEFTLSHSPDVINQRIDVKVNAAGSRLIFVSVRLDSSPLGDDLLSPPVTQYERTFNQAGTRTPGQAHNLLVTARDENGKEESASKIWQD